MIEILNRALHECILKPPDVLIDTVECPESRSMGLTLLFIYVKLRHYPSIIVLVSQPESMYFYS